MAAAASDRLSDLSDDVLIQVLSFIPSKEAARTTVLSRRWRCPLWLDTAVVNLDSRSYTAACSGSPASDADHALAFQHSHGRVPNKVTVVMHNGWMHDDILRAACRDKATVEELRLDCKDRGWPPCETMYCKACADSRPQMYSPPPDLLPFAALRVLDPNGCHVKDVMNFLCLVALRLRLCSTDIATLQDTVSGAPVLAELGLESLRFADGWSALGGRRLCLRCPAATAIAITNMAARESDRSTIEIDAPHLRRFLYTQHVWFGPFELVSFKSPRPAGLERVDINVRSPAAPVRSILGMDECHTRVLNLSVFSIADIVDRIGILPDFPNLELLEIEELCGCLDDRFAAVRAMMDMLHCCPTIRELRLNFTYLDRTSIDPADYAAAMSELTPCRSLFDEDGSSCCEVSYFPASSPTLWLMDPWRSSLKKVTVRSDVEELTCFHVQLVSFLARNAKSLDSRGGRHCRCRRKLVQPP